MYGALESSANAGAMHIFPSYEHPENVKAGIPHQTCLVGVSSFPLPSKLEVEENSSQAEEGQEIINPIIEELKSLVKEQHLRNIVLGKKREDIKEEKKEEQGQLLMRSSEIESEIKSC